MAVAHSAASESHTGTTGSTNQASFSWTHTQTGTPRGVVVFVSTYASVSDFITSVTYGGVALTRLSGGLAQDGNGESGRMDAFFLGSGLSSDNQTITVNRTNNATVMYAAAATVTAGADTAVPTATIVLLEGDGTLAAQSVDDTSPGQNSVRYAGCYSGLNAPPTAGTGSTLLNSIDIGNYGSALVRETTAGQGARSIGFTGATDDRAAVHLAIRELVPRTETPIVGTFTLTGNAADLLHNVKLDGGTGAFTFTGNPATLTEATPKSITAETGTFALTGNDVTARRDIRITADHGQFTLTGNDAAFTKGRSITADLGQFFLPERNLRIWSESFDDAAWTKTNVSITANSTTAPDGTLTADTLIENTVVNTTHILARNASFTAGVKYTASIYVKTYLNRDVSLLLGTTAAFGGANNTTVIFSPSTNTFLLTQNSPEAYGSEDVGNGWYRIYLTKTAVATATTTSNLQLRIGTNNVYTGDGVSGAYVWGAQLEEGDLTSYDPTGPNAATRTDTRHDVRIDGARGEFTLTGNAASLLRTYRTVVDAGAYVVTGQPITFSRTRVLQVDRGLYTLTGRPANLGTPVTTTTRYILIT